MFLHPWFWPHPDALKRCRCRRGSECATGWSVGVLVLGVMMAVANPGIKSAGADTGGGGARHPQDGAHADVRIRIDETGVTYNVQMNLVFMDFVAGVPRESFDQLDPFEEEPVREAIIDFFQTKIKVVIDGVEVAGELLEYDFRRPRPELLPLFPRTGMRGLLKSHLILQYAWSGLPESVRMTWEGFPPDTFTYPDLDLEETPPLVLAALVTAEGADKLIHFSFTEPEYTWHATGETLADRFLPVPSATASGGTISLPIVSLGLLVSAVGLLGAGLFSGNCCGRRKMYFAAAPTALIVAGLTLHVGTIEIQDPFGSGDALPSETEAVEIFAPLHANIYRAFDYTEREQIYDALAESVDGELLDALYNEIFRSLIMQDEGGAVSRVQAVTPLETEITSIGYLPPENTQPSFTLRARWRVEGLVYHWGHSHTRLNEYAAEYTLISTEEGWRIGASRVTEQFRVEMETAGEVEDGGPVDVLLPGEDI